MTRPAPTITVAGYLSLDTIECPRGLFRDVPGGAALYAALGARLAGGRARLVAKVAEDFPCAALDSLCRLDIDLGALERVPGKTRRARLEDWHASAGQEARRASPHYRNSDWWSRTYALAPSPSAVSADAMVLCPMPAEVLEDHLRAGEEAGALVIADVSEGYAATQADALLACLPRLDLFAPSRQEVRLLLPDLSDEDAQKELAARCRRVVRKCGADGLWWSSREGPTYRHPSLAREVVDSTGAGDATVGALAAGLACGLEPPELLELASRIAARALSAVGATALGLHLPSSDGG